MNGCRHFLGKRDSCRTGVRPSYIFFLQKARKICNLVDLQTITGSEFWLKFLTSCMDLPLTRGLYIYMSVAAVLLSPLFHANRCMVPWLKTWFSRRHRHSMNDGRRFVVTFCLVDVLAVLARKLHLAPYTYVPHHWQRCECTFGTVARRRVHAVMYSESSSIMDTSWRSFSSSWEIMVQ